MVAGGICGAGRLGSISNPALPPFSVQFLHCSEEYEEVGNEDGLTGLPLPWFWRNMVAGYTRNLDILSIKSFYYVKGMVMTYPVSQKDEVGCVVSFF